MKMLRRFFPCGTVFLKAALLSGSCCWAARGSRIPAADKSRSMWRGHLRRMDAVDYGDQTAF